MSLSLLLVSAFASTARAQGVTVTIAVSDTVMEIRLTDGSVLFGRVVATDGDQITIATESGARTEVNRAQIASIRPTTTRLVNGKRWIDDPNATRLFFGPTGRAIGQGTGYFAVYELLMPFLSYGITDRISMSGGTPIVPGAMGELFYAAPKVTVISRPGVDLAAGALAFFVPTRMNRSASSTASEPSARETTRLPSASGFPSSPAATIRSRIASS